MLNFSRLRRQREERWDAAGEGSRGGHVIGHTSGGKPIYSSNKGPAPSADHHAALHKAITEHPDFANHHRTPEQSTRAHALAEKFSKAHTSGDIAKLKKAAIEEGHAYGPVDDLGKAAREHLKANEGGGGGSGGGRVGAMQRYLSPKNTAGHK